MVLLLHKKKGGAAAGDHMSVLDGVEQGDVVVTDGSFYVRAERERLGLRSAAASAATWDRPRQLCLARRTAT